MNPLFRLAEISQRALSTKMDPHDVATELRHIARELDSKVTAPENPKLQALIDRCYAAMDDLKQWREERAKR